MQMLTRALYPPFQLVTPPPSPFPFYHEHDFHRRNHWVKEWSLPRHVLQHIGQLVAIAEIYCALSTSRNVQVVCKPAQKGARQW